MSDLILPVHTQWRKYQKETVEQILESPKKFILLNAPPGSGKSSLAVATAINSEYKRTVITTITRQLSEQYKRSANEEIGLVTVEGRANFPCLIKHSRTASEGPCVAGYKCFKKLSLECPYYKQKADGLKARLAVMNLMYFLTEANYSSSFSELDFLCIDEAHKLDSILANFIEIRLSKRSLTNIGLSWPGNLSSPTQYKEFFADDKKQIIAEYAEATEMFSFDYNNELLMARIIQLDDALKLLTRLNGVTNSWFQEPDELGITLKPVWIREFTEPYLFRHANKVLLMSATLPEGMAKRLNIVDYEYISVPSLFPKENRPLIYLPIANMAQSAQSPILEQRKMVVAVDSILEKFPNSKGLIHTVSYKLTQFVMQNSTHIDRFLTHTDSASQQTALATFRNSDKPVVFISPSVGMGVDLPYSLVDFQIITKVPYLSLGDELTKRRLEQDPEWYSMEAIMQLIQMYGRAMRAEDDRGVTYILDTCLDGLLKRYWHIVARAEWFIGALQVQRDGKLQPYRQSKWSN